MGADNSVYQSIKQLPHEQRKSNPCLGLTDVLFHRVTADKLLYDSLSLCELKNQTEEITHQSEHHTRIIKDFTLRTAIVTLVNSTLCSEQTASSPPL